MYAPVVVPPSAVQLVVGAAVVAQQVPRAVIEAGTPREETVAPRVAVVVVTEETVGVTTVGTTLAAPVVNCTSAPYEVPALLVA